MLWGLVRFAEMSLIDVDPSAKDPPFNFSKMQKIATRDMSTLDISGKEAFEIVGLRIQWSMRVKYVPQEHATERHV